MILKGNQRANGRELALHLLNAKDNEHCTIHELRGFLADDLIGAFDEAEAISLGTKCEQYLFSASFNPPPDKSVSIEAFESAIDELELKLGLVGQPRAIVFHEKLGRRHAHCVWSRINVDQMKAINLPFYKDRMMQMSHDFFVEHEWEMPSGLQDRTKRNHDNYTHAEAGQAKRVKRDPAKLKAVLRRCWEQSDSQASFAAALREQGFILARGDKRGFVAVSADGEIYSLSRWCSVKAKDMRSRLGMPDGLPSVADALEQLQKQPKADHARIDSTALRTTPDIKELEQLVARQRSEREALTKAQLQRQATETRDRAQRLSKGLRAVWDRFSGKYADTLEKLEAEANAARLLDRRELDALIDKHLIERRALSASLPQPDATNDFHTSFQDASDRNASQFYALDPKQPLILPREDTPFTRAEIKQKPERVLDILSAKKARFTRNDIVRKLAEFNNDPLALGIAIDKALRSDSLVRFDDGATVTYSTRDFEATKDGLSSMANEMASLAGFNVKTHNIDRAIRIENAKLQKRHGGKLSEEQSDAIRHLLRPDQMSAVVGFAGAGKSTLLSAAKNAWEQSGYKVHGAALAGKAVDSLQSASGINARTLASLEASWKNGYEPVSTGDIVVIDEAGMVGTRQLHRVCDELMQRGCKVVLIGDPEQLQPIEAGRPFKDIIEQMGAAKLTEIRRQSEDWQRDASQNFAKGQAVTAFAAYENKGTVDRTKSGDTAIAKLVDNYLADIEQNGSSSTRLALAHRRTDVHAINQSIKAGLRATKPDAGNMLYKTDHGPRAFGEGDRILFTRNDNVLGVKNGMLGTVQSVRDNQITLMLDDANACDGREITLNPKIYKSFDHGFAVSIHRAQGCTVDRSFVLSSTTLDRHLAYVAMTRHRESVQFYSAPDIESKRIRDPQRPSCQRRRPDRSRKRTF